MVALLVGHTEGSKVEVRRESIQERERELRLEVEGLLPSLSGKGERVGDITEEVRVQADI